MSFGIDVDLLLYASDRRSPRHRRACGFLRACAADGRVFCLAWLTLMNHPRLATQPRPFAQLSLMPAHHARRRPLAVANARHSPSHGCALRLDRPPSGALFGHARKTLGL